MPSFEEIARERYVSLATFRRDGREVRTPVWIAADGDRLYVFSEGHAGKVKRIRATRRVRLAACNARGRVHGEWVEGRGRVIGDEPPALARGYAALRRKYGWQMALADVLSKLSGRYATRALLELSPGAPA
jgi:PPOX class probable F420-dependent enzyme